jgi:hypothetical protein
MGRGYSDLPGVAANLGARPVGKGDAKSNRIYEQNGSR